MTKKKLTIFFRILFHVDYTHNQAVSYQLKMSCNSKSCIGCLHEQPNQMAHMDIGGCLYARDEEEVWETSSEDSETNEDFIQDLATEIRADQAAALEEGTQRLLEVDFGDDESEAWAEEESKEEVAEKEPEPEKPPLFEAPIPLGECPICYEELKMIDFTVTKCGHTFHSSCVFKAMEQNVDCPMCRCQLLEVQEEDEYEESVDEEEGEDQEDDEDDSDEEDDPKVTLEQLYANLQNMGYTPLDILSRAVYPSIILKRQDESRNVMEFQDELGEKIWDLVYGNISLAHVDQRTYAQVAAKALEPQVQVQAV